MLGSSGTLLGRFDSADGIAVSEALGLVAITDQGNYRVQVFGLDDIEAHLE